MILFEITTEVPTSAEQSNRSTDKCRETASCEPINDINEVPLFEYHYPASSTDITKTHLPGKRKASEATASKSRSRGNSSIGSKGRSSIASTNLMSKDWKRSDSSVSLKDCEIVSREPESDDLRNDDTDDTMV